VVEREGGKEGTGDHAAAAPPTSPLSFPSSPIPHPIFTADNAEVCLFVKDAPGGGAKDAKKRAAEAKLAAKAGVTKVLAVSKLKTKFEPHEAKRRLAGAYDLFLADARVLPMLAKALGKGFFRAKKQPVPVDLTSKDWAAPIERAVSSTYMFRGGGSCVNIKVGRTAQGADAVAANARAALAAALPHVAGGWAGVASVMLKLASSAALPVYQAGAGGKGEEGVGGAAAPAAVEA
jgi:ribosome biogenesis protein UTP30